MLMLRAAQSFPEIKLFRTVPGVGPIGACRFSAYCGVPARAARGGCSFIRRSASARNENSGSIAGWVSGIGAGGVPTRAARVGC